VVHIQPAFVHKAVHDGFEVAVAILLGVIPQVDYLALQLEVVFIRPFFKFFEVLYMQFRQLVVGDFALSYEIIDDMQKNLLREGFEHFYDFVHLTSPIQIHKQIHRDLALSFHAPIQILLVS
jgi:hypothetical protein